MVLQGDGSFDAVVVGAGPAGCAAALALAGACLRVALLERPGRPARRAGESLPPDATPLLHSLDLWESFVRDGHLPSPGIVSVWGDETPYETSFIFNPYRVGWHLDRGRFDATLAAVAEQRGAVHLRSTEVRSCSRDSAGRWWVAARSGGRSARLAAEFLIDATGRTAWLARRLGARPSVIDRLIGVAGTFEAGGARHDPRLLLEATEWGWWYSAVLPGDRLIVAYMTDLDFLPPPLRALDSFWATRLEETVWTRCRVAGAGACSSLRTTPADSRCLGCAAGEKWLAVGDAAMAWDPLSSQGVSNALRSGIAAALAIGEARSGRPDALDEYAAGVARSFEEYRRLRGHYYRQERRWPHSPFWERRWNPPSNAQPR
jgi:flavin-dependent dehydrogenase